MRRQAVATITLVTFLAPQSLGAQPGMPPPGGGVGQNPAPRIFTYPPNAISAATVPIVLDGAGGVSDTGASTYAIPLKTPPGPLGLEPDLGILYAGNANGYLGAGWTMTGLSIITPCERTIASEGIADHVSLDGDDVYCLDGAKLVPRNDPDFPSAAGARTFHTEVETYQHVVANGPETAQPTSFTVYNRDGSRRTYAPTLGKRLSNLDATTDPTSTQVAIAYPITELVDRVGNKIRYFYEYEPYTMPTHGQIGTPLEHLSSYRISRIDYSFTDGSTPRRQVKFYYQGRPDPMTTYRHGVAIATQSRLERVEMWAPNPTSVQEVWEYRFGYATSPETARSLLQSVQLCEPRGGCSYQRQFVYSRSGSTGEHVLTNRDFEKRSWGFDQHTIFGHLDDATSNWPTNNDVRVMLGDLDGDGDDDAVVRTTPTRYGKRDLSATLPLGGAIKVRLSGDTKPLELVDYRIDGYLEDGVEEAMTGGVGNPGSEWEFSIAVLGKSRLADLDHDGDLDLMLARFDIDQGAEMHDAQGNDFYGWWQYGFATYESQPFRHWDQMTLIGDDVPLDVKVEGWERQLPGNSASRFFHLPPMQRMIADLDGDGRVEVVDPFRRVTYHDLEWWEDDPYHTLIGSLFRADLSTVNGPGPDVELMPGYTCGNGHAMVIDANGDGRQDILTTGDASVTEYPDPITSSLRTYRRAGLGKTFPTSDHGYPVAEPTSALWAGECEGAKPDLILGDFNGDGLADALYPPGQYGDNLEPLVRWNIGTGFSRAVEVNITGDLVAAGRLDQKVPNGKDGEPVGWDRGTRVADVDGDGRTDIIAMRADLAECRVQPFAPYDSSHTCTTRLIVYRSRGEAGFVAEEVRSWTNGNVNLTSGFPHVQLGDVNGDGAVDVVHAVNDKLQVNYLKWRTTPDLLERVNDQGTPYSVDVFEYDRAWWGDKPRHEATTAEPYGPAPCAWPVACPKAGFTTVRSHRRFVGSSASGPMYRTTYHAFEDPRHHLAGRGSLGFAVHRSWERESGTYTVRTFDNTTKVDADPSRLGGEFYPFAHRAAKVVTITPREITPTAAELASDSKSPGLESSEIVRTRDVRIEMTWTTSMLEDGRILRIHPATKLVNTYDDPDQQVALTTIGIPGYSMFYPDGYNLRSATTYTFDADGNLSAEVTDRGTNWGWNVREELRFPEYDKARSRWQLGAGRPKLIERIARPSGASYAPVAVDRLRYSSNGNVVIHEQRARNEDFAACDAWFGAPYCETKGAITSYRHDAFGNPTQVTLEAADVAENRVTDADWDSDGVFPMSSTDALGFERTMMIHPALGVPLRTIDENDQSATYTYDGFGRLLTSTMPESANLTRTYATWTVNNRRGFEVTNSQPDGTRSYVRTDELGRVVETGVNGFGALPNDPKWVRTTTAYDTFGNVVLASTPHSTGGVAGLHVASYDRVGQLLQRSEPAVNGNMTTVYEPSLERTNVLDPGGHVTFTRRDPVGRVAETGHIVDGETYGDVSFQYGAFGHVEHVVDALGNRTSYEYDELGNRTSEQRPDAGRFTYTYDGLGRTKTVTRPTGGVTAYEYDVLGREIERSSPDGVVTRTYDEGPGANGKLTKVEAPHATTSFAFDDRGRLSSVIQSAAGQIDSMFYRYDAYSRVSHILYPLNPTERFKIQYRYHAGDGMLRNIYDVSQCNISTDPSVPPPGCIPSELWRVDDRNARMQVKTAHFGNGATETREYHEPSGVLTKLDGPGVYTMYAYDDENLLAGTTESSGRNERFTYDDLHRLETWGFRKSKRLPMFQTTGYVYDELGNLRAVAGSAPFTTTFDATRPHRLLSSTSGSVTTTYGYDAGGRQITAGARTTVFNELDLPTQVTANLANRKTYEYDGLGSRVKKHDTSTGITTRYFGKLFESRQSFAGRTNVYYVHADTGVVAQVDYAPSGAKTRRYMVNDRLGHARSIHSGSPVTIEESAFYDPFGARVDHDGARIDDPNRATTGGFTGHEDDGGGLVNMRGRIYDRNQYRFLTPDPYIPNPMFGQSYNPYSYVYNNPTSYRDPSGFEPHSDGGGGVEGGDPGTDTTDGDGGDVAPGGGGDGDPDPGPLGDPNDPGMVMEPIVVIGPGKTDGDAGRTSSGQGAPDMSMFTNLTPLTSTSEMAAYWYNNPDTPTAAKVAAGAAYVVLYPFASSERSPLSFIEGLEFALETTGDSINEANANFARADELAARGADEAGLDAYMAGLQHSYLGLSKMALTIALGLRAANGAGPVMKGMIGENIVEEGLAELGVQVVGKQIPMTVTSNGVSTTTRLDFVVMLDNQLTMIEVKVGGSQLTVNQTVAYPLLQSQGGTLGSTWGMNPMRLPAGSPLVPGGQIGPTNLIQIQIPVEAVVDWFVKNPWQ